jgi:glyoxylase-like metal-dependent hydrolase (beta-lactamase superfamily II)
MGGKIEIRAFFDEATNTVTYLVWSAEGRRGVVIDPLLDFDPASGAIDDHSVSAVLAAAEDAGVAIEWVLETHVHADHLSGAQPIKARTGARIAIGEKVRDVQAAFLPAYGAIGAQDDSGDFDRLVKEGDKIEVGDLSIEVLYTPGHTPADVSYRIGDAIFVGDTLFMPDYGTARTDFPGGSARQLYRSIRKILSLPPATRIFTCHDYGAPGRDAFAWESSVAEQRRSNSHVRDGIAEDEFVAMREARDKGHSTPKLYHPAIQVNIRGGRLPEPDSNGVRYIRIPLTLNEPDRPG